MSFEYDRYLNSGDYVKFENVGDAVIGVVKEVREGKDFNGNPCPELILELDDGEEKTVTAGQVRLKAELAEKRPNVGDRVRITYSGVSRDARPGRAPSKEFTVEVKEGPHELKQPAVSNSDAPF